MNRRAHFRVAGLGAHRERSRGNIAEAEAVLLDREPIEKGPPLLSDNGIGRVDP